ncbi:MAG TPA: DUF4833 domain-containing protein [Polyangiaceae bacterium]
MRRAAAWALGAVLGVVAGSSTPARAEVVAPSAIDVPLFTISKSENRNQVQYVIRVDEHCTPLTDAPVWAYWRMIELGPTRTEPLLGREQRAYGIAGQWVLERGAEGGKVRVVLRAMPSRPIEIESGRSPAGACVARSTMLIAGAPARLFGVYAKLKWPVGVDYLLLQGWSLDGTHVVTERVKG